MTRPPCEISWFSALCDDDYEFLGLPDPMLQSSWEHCRDIVCQAEAGGFDNILLPSGYELGIDTTAFTTASPDPNWPTIGYFARMIHGKGLTTLVDAYIDLAKRGSVPRVKLRIGGAKTPIDEK